MALDAKAIKEEIPDKETYETNSRKIKGGKEHCKTPDSPEGARAVAPRSPISPKIHHSSLVPPRTNRNGSISPIINGHSDDITPPPTATPISSSILTQPILSQDPARALIKIKRFLGALVQFAQDTCHDNGDKVRALVLSLASGGLTSEEFKIALQDATNFPVRPNVLPFLRIHIPLLQREIASLARNNNQTPMQYVRANENSVIEFTHNTTESTDIFLPIDGGSSTSNLPTINGNAHNLLKRRGSENFMENHNGQHEWGDLLPSKRPYHSMMIGTSAPHIYPAHSQFLDFQNNSHQHSEPFTNTEKLNSQRDDRDIRSLSSDSFRRDRERDRERERSSGEEEWKNIYTMLSCISAMVEKTKRAITILQQRSSDLPTNLTDSTLSDIKRQTEEKVAEFRRNAEEAVNQVKRQAVIEIQRAVATAENRAVEIMAQERLKMDKFFSELNKASTEPIDGNSQSPIIPGSQNVCWNCGRKANETCSGCNFARYCGAFCQHKDWEQHHQICGTNRIDQSAAIVAATSKNSTQNNKPPMRSSPPQPPTTVSQTQQQPPPQTQQQQQQQQQQQREQQTPVTNGVTCGIK